MGKLLLDEAPMQVQASLATAIGLNEAIALQQLHWVLQNPNMGKVVDGKKYIYMSCTDWRVGHFPFWSDSTIQRTFNDLEKTGLIATRSDLNSMKFDRTKWYTVNLEAVEELEVTFQTNGRIIDHVNLIDEHVKMKNASRQNEPTIPESSLPETSSETSEHTGAQNAPDPLPPEPASHKPEEPPKPEKPVAPSKKSIKKESLFPVASALADVCQMELCANRGRLFKEAKQLATIPNVTAEAIREHYGPGSWWFHGTWRSKEGAPPTPGQIRQTWGQWLIPKVMPVVKPTKMDIIAQIKRQWEMEDGKARDDRNDSPDVIEHIPAERRGSASGFPVAAGLDGRARGCP